MDKNVEKLCLELHPIRFHNNIKRKFEQKVIKMKSRTTEKILHLVAERRIYKQRNEQ